jgi:hypothetical protein
MPRDFENLYDIEHLSDPDLKDLILEKIREEEELDADAIEVRVQNGTVRVSGRVGTEEEIQEIDMILADELGILDFANEVLVDEAVRAEHSEASDDARVEDEAVEDELGESGKRTESTAEHLMPDPEGELYGTRDLQRAVERGESYNPPDRPPQLGSRSRENH